MIELLEAAIDEAASLSRSLALLQFMPLPDGERFEFTRCKGKADAIGRHLSGVLKYAKQSRDAEEVDSAGTQTELAGGESQS